jgi:hypothetical protein
MMNPSGRPIAGTDGLANIIRRRSHHSGAHPPSPEPRRIPLHTIIMPPRKQLAPKARCEGSRHLTYRSPLTAAAGGERYGLSPRAGRARHSPAYRNPRGSAGCLWERDRISRRPRKPPPQGVGSSLSFLPPSALSFLGPPTPTAPQSRAFRRTQPIQPSYGGRNNSQPRERKRGCPNIGPGPRASRPQ